LKHLSTGVSLQGTRSLSRPVDPFRFDPASRNPEPDLKSVLCGILSHDGLCRELIRRFCWSRREEIVESLKETGAAFDAARDSIFAYQDSVSKQVSKKGRK
jgi:hypothetical protein